MALVGVVRRFRVSQVLRFSKSSFNFLTETNVTNVPSSLSFNIFHCKNLCTEKSTKTGSKPSESDPNAPQKPKKRKPLTSPEITLILPESDVISVTLEHAEKLSKRRNLKLVKIIDFDTKTEKPLYKLMTNQQFFEEDNKTKEQKRKDQNSVVKEAKLYTISAKISEHDMYVKIKQMIKALTKRHEVRIYLSQDGNPSKAEIIAQTIEEELKEVSSSNKRLLKGTTMKLLFQPITEQNNETETKSIGKESNEKTDKTENTKVKASAKE